MRKCWRCGVWIALTLCTFSTADSRSLADSDSTGSPAINQQLFTDQPNGTPQHSRQQSLRYAALEARSFASRDGVVFWTLANNSWLDFVLNWVENVWKAGIKDFFVATLDEELAKVLKQMGTPCVMLKTELGGLTLDWGSDAFKQRGIEKIRFIIAMLEVGMQPLFSDLDVVWLKDPRPFVASVPDANILVSTDSCMAQQATPLDNCMQVMGTSLVGLGKMNVGIHLIRPSALNFAKAWLEEMEKSREMEQYCWNRVFMRDLDIPGPSDTHDLLCRCMSGSIKAGILPAALFLNGYTAFTQHLTTGLLLDPFSVHASYVGGPEMKRFHLREEGMWMVDEVERFNSPSQKLLALDLDVPDWMLAKSAPPENLQHNLEMKDAEGHLQLLRHQFSQIKAAAEMAVMLNRTLVMPKLYCGMENHFQPHNGRFWEGVQNYTLPMQCSMVNLFDVKRWNQEVKDKGVLPRFVESSFLDNPKMDLKFRDRMQLDVCAAKDESKSDCCGGPSHSVHGHTHVCRTSRRTLRMLPVHDKSHVKSFLKGFEAVKLIRMKNILQFWWLPPRDMYGEFDYAFDGIRRDWCCAQDSKPVTIDIAIPSEMAN